MINSMTGYGQAQGEVDGVSYAVEIKTVNNRYLKLIIKLPELLAFLEEDVEKLLRRNLVRGTVNYLLRLKETSGPLLFDIDQKALQAVAEKLKKTGLAAGIKETFDIGNLLSLPGIVRPALPDDEAIDKIGKAVTQISQAAIDKLKQMRSAEGDFLEVELKELCQAIEKDLEQIRSRVDVVVQEHARKLKQRADMLLAEAKLKLDEETLAREVAIFADRSDISEEISRLGSHIQQFIQCCRSNELAGRRMDFISQEMLREANTIASKASDSRVAQYVVDIKCRIERIKEQVQNIE
jgi:uncharacterized protein (TIGR00255 family)